MVVLGNNKIANGKSRFAYHAKRSQLLGIIRDRKEISRVELVEATGISAPVVTRLTNDLIEENIIDEVGKGQLLGSGRPPMRLSMNKSSRFIVSVDIGPFEIKAILANLRSEIIEKEALLTPRNASSKTLEMLLKKVIRGLVERKNLMKDQLEGIAFSASGRIDNEHGICESCNIPVLRDISLRKLVEKIFPGVPVVVASSNTGWALAERLKANTDVTEKESDILIVHCGYGISITPLVRGKVPLGFTPVPRNDFGHITYDCAGPPCHCGSHGCIESFAGGWAIEREARQHPSVLLLSLVDKDASRITAKEVFRASEEGDSRCQNILQRAGRILGKSLVMFVQYYAPSSIIFAGGLVENSNSLYYRGILDEMSRSILPERFAEFNFSLTSLDKFAGTVGATHILLNEFIHGPLETMLQRMY